MSNQIIFQTNLTEGMEISGVGGGEAGNGIQTGANHVCEAEGVEVSREKGE